MKITAFLVILPLFMLWIQRTTGQTPNNDSQKGKLHQEIMHMDSVMFNAFNHHDLETLKQVFAKDLEFYQDRDGLSNYAATITSFQKLFGGPMRVSRELVQSAVEVYAIPGYGAVEVGEHKFTATQNGQSQSQIYKFVHTWHYKDGHWQVTRAISVGH